jgi:hypothetical protein
MNRKITFLSALVAVIFIASATEARGEKQIVTENKYSYQEGAEKPATPSSSLNKFYNQANKLDLELNATSSKSVYSYNAQGLTDTLFKYSWNANTKTWSLSSKTGYEYDDETGLLTRAVTYNVNTDTITGYIEYLNYENGFYQDAKTMNYNGTSVSYWAHYDYTFDDGGLLIEQIRSYKPDEETANPIDKTIYTYSGNQRATAEVQAYVNGEWQSDTSGTSRDTYTYDGDGLLVRTVRSSISRYGTYIEETENVYGDLQATYAPTGLTAALKTGAGAPVNTVELQWTASASTAVTGYRVICDSIVADVVTGTSFTTSTTVMNGKHSYAVIALVGSDFKNISNQVILDVLDEGVKPAKNLTVTDISDKDEDDGSYNVTVAWEAAQTNSVITGYRVYYTDYSYISAEASSAVVNLPYYLCEGTNSDGDLEGKEVKIFVVAVYETGIADKSNVVTVIPFSKTIVGLQTIKKEAALAAYPNPAVDILNFPEPVSGYLYNAAGNPVKVLKNESSISVSGLPSGLYVVKTGKENGSAAIKVIIK